MNIDFVIDKLADYGELHLVVEEHESVAGDDFIGIRTGNTKFDDKNEVLIVDDGRKEHYIGYDRIVYAEPAIEFPD